jgi:hypothetical protein
MYMHAYYSKAFDAATGSHSRVRRTRARLRGRSRRVATPCAARACPASTADRCANRACCTAWAHHRLVLQQLSVCTAHGVCAKHREQQGRHEQHEHAHTAQVDSSAHGRWSRLHARWWVGAPAPTSRIGGSHSRGRPAQTATCDKARTTRVWGAAGIPLGRRRTGGCVAARGCADGACDLGHTARTDGEHDQQQVPQRRKHGCRVPAMHLCDAHWSAVQQRCGPYAYAAVSAERGSAVRGSHEPAGRAASGGMNSESASHAPACANTTAVCKEARCNHQCSR